MNFKKTNSEVIEIKGDQKMQQAVLKNLKTNEEKF